MDLLRIVQAAEGIALSLWQRLSAVGAQSRRDLSVWADVRAFPALGTLCGLNCVALLLIAQRLRPGASVRLSAAQVALVATVACALSLAARFALARVERGSRPTAWLQALACAACCFPLVALIVAANARLGIIGHAYLLGLALVSGTAGAFWNARLTDRLLTAGMSRDGRRPSRVGLHIAHGTVAVEPDEFASRVEPGATLWMERRTAPSGEEAVQGVAAAEFSGGQQTAIVHIPFCPPLKRLPELALELVEARSVRIKSTAAYPWGCRIELKRSGDLSAEARAEIRFRAALHAARKAA